MSNRTSDLQKLPNFFIVGAMKCGTTSLRDHLHNHPDIFMVYPEEPRFFYNDTKYAKGLEQYLKWFEGVSNESAIGEGSGYYGWRQRNEKTSARIAKNFPSAKIIYMVRHPLERLESHWSWDIANGVRLGNINRAVNKFPYLIEMSKFWKQIKSYRSYFNDEQIKVLFFEDFIAEPKKFMREVFRFLDVDEGFVPPSLTEARNPTDGRLTDSKFLVKLRIVPGFRSVTNIAPDKLVTYFRNRLKTRKKSEPRWSESVFKKVIDDLLDDSRSFLKYCGRSEDYWDWPASARTTTEEPFTTR